MSEIRKLAAILVTDVVGYSRLARIDEDDILSQLRVLRGDLIEPTVAMHHGRVVKSTGDGSLVEFGSVVNAVQCAIKIQTEMLERNSGRSSDRRVELRIGIHLGDVVQESDGDLMGDGVNVAARLEGVCEPGCICLSEQAYWQVRARLEVAVIDRGAVQLKNIPDPVHVYSLQIGDPNVRGAAQMSPRNVSVSTVASEPVVAVLPFTVAGDSDPVLVDGIIEEITDGLARFKTVTIIARASAFAFPATNRPSPQVVSEKLGADHLVEGTFRRTTAGFRISVTLTHAPSSRQIWGESFDCAEADLLGIDLIIARRIISRLVANIEESVLRRSATKPAASLHAFEYLTRGIVYLRGYGQDVNEKARDYFLRAIAIDSSYGLAYAYLALSDLIIAEYGSAPRPVLEACRNNALQALTFAPEEARCHRIMALVRLYLREHAAAEGHLQRALDLNPYDADTLAQMGYLRTMRGYALDGLRWLNRAAALNPFHPPWYHFDRSMALYVLGRYAEAVEAIEGLPLHHRAPEILRAAAHAMSGNEAAAARYITIAVDMKPDLGVETDIERGTEFERESDLAHLLEGVRLAMAACRPSSHASTR